MRLVLIALSLQAPVECSICHTVISRKADFPRHMLTHASNKEELYLPCPIPGCCHRTLQKSNLQTHIAGHTKNGRRESSRPAAAAYPSVRYITPQVEIPASLDLNDLTFPECAGFTPSGSRSRYAKSSDTRARFTGEFKELSSDGLFDLPAEELAPNHLHPPIVPANLITFHIDPQARQLVSIVIRPQASHNDGFLFRFQSQQPLSNEGFQSPSGAAD
ncbi:hypothetical protein CY34DRAFT_89894 [Suillus luteus UH-Slu-Lm8-n1]|uniref:C2H2-type domain-containing protein n=1 Tax=Suillus luteus UH-Slu-Lm8-n1 TaxID=930992 RepID=A0A0D0B5G3_9AGAM|nr:hypothetical protein CY34DRAFT_89894 [Suillus luteus UH-Slu-Lm8-n1]